MAAVHLHCMASAGSVWTAHSSTSAPPVTMATDITSDTPSTVLPHPILPGTVVMQVAYISSSMLSVSPCTYKDLSFNYKVWVNLTPFRWEDLFLPSFLFCLIPMETPQYSVLRGHEKENLWYSTLSFVCVSEEESFASITHHQLLSMNIHSINCEYTDEVMFDVMKSCSCKPRTPGLGRQCSATSLERTLSGTAVHSKQELSLELWCLPVVFTCTTD